MVEESDEESDEDEIENDDEEENDHNINIERKRAIGGFLLHLRGNTNIAEDQITEILHKVQHVVGVYVEDYLNRLKLSLQERG